MGVIVRTVAEGKSDDVIKKDYSSLIANWKSVNSKNSNKKAPSLAYEDLETASSVIRDLYPT